MTEFPWRLVTVDIDGTLTTVHGWRFLAESLGKLPEYLDSDRRFGRRETSEDEHLAELLQFAEGLTIRELDAILEATPKVSGIAEGVAALHDHGAKVALLTHNPPDVCAWYAQRFGFDDFDGVTGVAASADRIGPANDVRADKPGGLGRLLVRFGASPDRTAHIGDGWADAQIFPRVGGAIAFNTHLPEVRRAADLALDGGDFRLVVPALGRLSPRRPVNDAPVGL